LVAAQAWAKKSGIWIGETNLLVRGSLHLLCHLSEGLHRPAQALDLLLQAGCPDLGLLAALPVSQISSRLRWLSGSNLRLEGTRLR
jgi:hypothetical protein